ncbi:hypothetical protein ACFFWD_29595, partial [Bradyrhizobium erythrophlei]|uniref:hypothetical protein n=1 Tax=Bradyrhizobium erythrophlei TaxID=1437360 RepID=UPI0035F0F928
NGKCAPLGGLRPVCAGERANRTTRMLPAEKWPVARPAEHEERSVVKKTTEGRQVREEAQAAPKKAAPKTTQRDRSISERLHALGKVRNAAEEFLKIRLEIDHACGKGGQLAFGEFGGRLAAAKSAWEDAILNSDNVTDWVAAARKAAHLP